jgi:hypothetical protein
MVSAVLLVAVLSPLAGVILAIIFYLRYCKPRCGGAGRRSAVLFIVGTFGFAIALAYVAYNYLPWVFCEGSLIDLGGAGCALSVYVAAPFGFTIGTLAYAVLWSLNGKIPSQLGRASASD